MKVVLCGVEEAGSRGCVESFGSVGHCVIFAECNQLCLHIASCRLWQ